MRGAVNDDIMLKEDIQICELLRKRDPKGLTCLFEVYYKPLVLWGATFLQNIDQSEDLVQDFFVKLWENKTCEKLLPSTLKSYLYVSVRNLALNASIKTDPLRHACDLACFDEPWEEYDDFKEEIMYKVEKAIKELPERSREIVQCVYLKGMRYKEVAEMLNISVATVNTLLVNALKKLRQVSKENENVILLFSIYRSFVSENEEVFA